MKTSRPSFVIVRFVPVAVSMLLARPVPVCAQQVAEVRGPNVPSGPPTAEEIVQLVQRRGAFTNSSFAGELRKGDAIFPCTVNQTETLTRFCFQQDGGSQIVNVDAGSMGTTVTEAIPGSNTPAPFDRFSEGVCGTDLTWEDLSLRCLDWPAKTLQGAETVKTQRCWIVDLTNPGTSGPYGTVRVWVSDGSGFFFQIERGTLMKMSCFNQQGQRVKSLTAKSGMKVDGAMVFKEMVVSTYVPGTAKILSETTLERFKRASSAGAAQLTLPAGESDERPSTGAAAHFCEQWTVAAGLSGADALPAAVPHHDGVANLLKYAFNLAPNRPDSRELPADGTAGLPRITLVNTSRGAALRAEFLCRAGDGLIYTPQTSPALERGTWTPFTSTPVRTAVAPGWERVVYHEPVPAEGSFRIFARVEVTLREP